MKIRSAMSPSSSERRFSFSLVAGRSPLARTRRADCRQRARNCLCLWPGCDRDGLWHRSDLRLSHQPGRDSRHDERRPSSGAGSPWLHHRTVTWRGRGRSRALRDPVEQARGLDSRLRPGQHGWGEGYLGGYGLLGAPSTGVLAPFIFVDSPLARARPEAGKCIEPFWLH